MYLKDFKIKKNNDLISKLWRAIMDMDIIEVYTLLPEDIIFQNLTKKGFIELLDEKFRKHKIIGDDELYVHLLEGNKKHKDELICQFVGVESGINLGIFLEYEKEQLKGIQFCECFGGVEDLNEYYDWG